MALSWANMDSDIFGGVSQSWQEYDDATNSRLDTWDLGGIVLSGTDGTTDADNLTDVLIELTMHVVDTEQFVNQDRAFGLVLRYSASGFYLCSITVAGNFSKVQHNSTAAIYEYDGSWTELSATSGLHVADGDTLRAEIEGSNITFSCPEETWTVTASDATHASGTVGFARCNGGGLWSPDNVCVDNLDIDRIT